MDKLKADDRLRIGLTGGIASGKSVVASYLGSKGIGPIIDVDMICRELLLPAAPAWQKILDTFGPEYFNRDRTVDRRKLRQAIFSDPQLRKRLDGIIHPLAREVLLQRLEEGTNTGEIVIVEVPLLYEAHWGDLFDRVVVIYADPCRSLERLMRRDGCTREEAEAALSCQWSLKKKVLQADHVIDNSSSLIHTFLQVDRLVELLRNRP